MGRLIRVFLDANVIFSTALGDESFALLLELGRRGRVELVTSAYCVAEARINLEAKRPDAVDVLLACLAAIGRVADVHVPTDASRALLPDDDAVVLDAARACGADVLVTGDLRHFAPLMPLPRSVLGLTVRTVRAFLLEGPPQDVTDDPQWRSSEAGQ